MRSLALVRPVLANHIVSMILALPIPTNRDQNRIIFRHRRPPGTGNSGNTSSIRAESVLPHWKLRADGLQLGLDLSA
jgi:hypothetical protein